MVVRCYDFVSVSKSLKLATLHEGLCASPETWKWSLGCLSLGLGSELVRSSLWQKGSWTILSAAAHKKRPSSCRYLRSKVSTKSSMKSSFCFWKNDTAGLSFKKPFSGIVIFPRISYPKRTDNLEWLLALAWPGWMGNTGNRYIVYSDL